MERFKSEYLTASIRIGLNSLIQLHPKFQSVEGFFEDWVLKNPEAKSRFMDLLSQTNLSEEALYALAYITKIEAFESIERRIEAIAKRRSRVMNEILRRREFFAQRLREASDAEKSRLSKLHSQETCEAAE